jgi:hypothetical protein
MNPLIDPVLDSARTDGHFERSREVLDVYNAMGIS